MTWVRRNLPLVAFTVLVVAIFSAMTIQASRAADQVWKNQIAGCERTNHLRMENNTRIRSHTLDRDVLQKFLFSAAKARAAAPTALDHKTAVEYRRLAVELNNVRFNVTPLVDCKKAYSKP